MFRASVSAGQGPGVRSPVALKVYYPDQLEERVAREVRALRKLQSDTIARLHDSGHVNIRRSSCPYVATAFIEGTVLAEVLRRKPLDLCTSIVLGRDIATAITVLWSARIVHRDIKPRNVMIASEQRVVLIDLGVARHVALTDLTTAGKSWGTQGYMSPEQANGYRQLSCKSDVFALGIVMQECLLGRHPTAGNQASLMTGGVRTDGILKGIPRAMSNIIDSMLRPQAFQRPLPDEIAAEMRRLLVDARNLKR